MCELFGMSTSAAVAPGESLREFRQRGGQTADNPDGWGIAWRKNGAFRLAKEPRPACSSTLFENLCLSLCSDLIIAHVRKAKFPPVNNTGNTHPFQRVCCGKTWIFAHNGLVPDIVGIELANGQSVCRPEGETDSEYAFCHLLSHLAENSTAIGAASFTGLAAVSEMVATYGKFNFLMSDGEYLIAYGHDRLHYLERGGDNVMIATEPLPGGRKWTAFEAGELRVYRAGLLTGRILTHPAGIFGEALM